MSRWLGLVSALLFLLTAAIGVWAAYDRPVAVFKFILISAGLLLALGLAWLGNGNGKTETVLTGAGMASGLGAAALGLLFMGPGQFPSGPSANALVILLPLAMGNMIWTLGRRRWLPASVAGVSLLIGLIGLISTGEWTAWLALGIGLLGAGVLYRRFVYSYRGLSRWLFTGLVTSVAVGLCCYAFILISSSGQMFLLDLPIGPLAKRLPLWHDSLALVQDYFFTGSGLGCTAMVFSSYVFLLHVPFQDQAHNLFLQITLEQGVTGLVAFLGMVLAAILSLIDVFRRRDPSMHLAAATTAAAFVTLLVYGMFDSEAYASHLAPLLFLPFGCAWYLGARVNWDHTRSSFRTPTEFLGIIIPVVAVISLLLWPGAKSRWMANLGAVAQTNSELSEFSWPKWGLQDQLRCNQLVDLSRTMEDYREALTLDPLNVTAHRRLGQIELSRGNYLSAKWHLEMAYVTGPDQRATRQLLGEVYALTGNSQGAVKLWQTIDTSHGQFEVRRWWYENIGAQQELRRLTKAITLLKQQPESQIMAEPVRLP